MPQTDPNATGTELSRLLPFLYYEQEVGILRFESKGTSIRLHLNGGLLVQADGLDYETPFLREIARSKGLDANQLKDLLAMRGQDPEVLGLTLLERNLVTPVTWDTFLRLRARHHLEAALSLEDATTSFEAADIPLQPLSGGDQDLLEVLAAVLREMDRPAFFKRFIKGPQACFQRQEDPEQVLRYDLLNPEERGVLSLVKTQRTIGDMTSITGMEHETLYRHLCVLLFLGLVAEAGGQGGAAESEGAERPQSAQATELYVGLLEKILTRASEAVGAPAGELLGTCLRELKGPSRKLFEGVGIGEAEPWVSAGTIWDRYERMVGPHGGHLILTSSFNKLLFLLVLQWKQAAGSRETARLMDELLGELQRAEGEGASPRLVAHVAANLKDIRNRLLS